MSTCYDFVGSVGSLNLALSKLLVLIAQSWRRTLMLNIAQHLFVNNSWILCYVLTLRFLQMQ